MLLIFFAFLAGVVTILSPCILPILPIVLSGSLSGGKRRPLGIVTGFVASFTFFTLALTSIVRATGLPPDTLRSLAIVMILVFGLSLLLPQTQVLLEKLFTVLANFAPGLNGKKKASVSGKSSAGASTPAADSGFFGGVIVGISLGLVWAPCVGPILASVITLAVTSQVNTLAILITLSYSLGTALPMLAITYGGRQLLQKVPGLLSHTQQVQQAFGVFMVIMAVALFFNLDRQFQTFILEKFPQYGAGLTSIETNQSVSNELAKLKGLAPSINQNASSPTLMPQGTLAPDFTGGTGWINTPNSAPLSLKKELKGKVVLVDFWTYSCINCIRTMPYLRKWYDTYKDQDFVIVGVHTPEFEFEKDTSNVTKAVKDFQLTYPIVQDNNYAIWQAYNNQYWPAHYLIDKQGNIRYTHFGEGNYVETENAIRSLLNESMLKEAEVAMPNHQVTPETYLGYDRAEAYVEDNQIVKDKASEYSAPSPIDQDAVGLNGSWTIGGEKITSGSNGSSIKLNFIGSQVYLVMGVANVGIFPKVTVTMDGKPLPSKYYTADMNAQGEIPLQDYARKYDIVDLKQDYGRHEIELTFPTGVNAYAFTFGL